MSYDPRMAGTGAYGTPNKRDGSGSSAGKGSVRAARERLQAAQMQVQLPDRSQIVGLPARPNQPMSQSSAQYGSPPQQTRPSNASSPSPQWPLPNSTSDAPDSRSSPPQRPPRPTSDDFSLQPPSSRDRRPSHPNDEGLSPTEPSSRPLTTSSVASGSSIGSIPDFPVPQPPMPVIQAIPRRVPLGPPPSARRGPSSYYTQASYVSPIAEESEARSEYIHSHHGSFASSMVIPAHVDDYYPEDDDIDFETDDEAPRISGENGRESRTGDHEERGNLVRQASLGRRTKPALTTIKSSGSLKRENRDTTGIKRKPLGNSEGDVGDIIGGEGAVAVLQEQPSMTSVRHSPEPSNVSFASGTGLFDPSSSSESFDSLEKSKLGFGAGMTGLAVSRTRDFEKGNLDSSIYPLQALGRQTSLADRVGDRRPPKLNVDAVRDAEARGSLTSLPDLIRRATRLAANLDRGRTASRLGLDFWESGAPDKPKPRRSGSLSDMLAAFPPPGDATPSGDRTPNKEMSVWPTGAGFPTADLDNSDEKARRRRRKCCGMPMWTFVTLLIVLLFLVAAAVVIPIVLIVIPRMRDSTVAPNAATTAGNSPNPPASAPTTSSQPGQCDNIIKCENGGVAVPNTERSCNCVCINGFTGRTCATNSGAGCSTMDIAGTTKNATVGSGIPRLLTDAKENFSIPLDPPRLLALFSDLSLSCAYENALVTFNGLSARSEEPLRVPVLLEDPVRLPPPISHLSRSLVELKMGRFYHRQAIGQAVATASATRGNSPSPTSSPTSTISPTIPIGSNTTALDFARVVILLVLQETRKVDSAANAQESLQDFFNDHDEFGRSEDSVLLGNGYKVDLGALTLDLGNGTTIRVPPVNTT
ncbi:hypothetical protein GQ43DRAFT_133909 [Delitschia confertaspora ATCC 74209]|uniref:EGF-like domain-containing protein n=1 Tax=Delitschia confertaspora ATCC 74209 TaxID=1513339 RepID=A0A9P4JGL9_9PLEO|nr:hypothetical protein GQ43DRAFT_133909 [Delitschia confertaspora ATCC 74209]